MTYLLSIDPGESTGIALGSFSDSEPYRRKSFWQVEGGLKGFLDWYQKNTAEWAYYARDDGDPYRYLFPYDPDVIVSERFILRNNPFVANTEPLRIEGAMVALGMNPVWQLRTDKALVPDQVLKDNGLWLTGKAVGLKDARDANDATIHALAYLKKQHHAPTLKEYFS